MQRWSFFDDGELSERRDARDAQREMRAFWRSMMKVQLTGKPGEGPITVYGPHGSGDMGMFPLREYAVRKYLSGPAVVLAEFAPYDADRRHARETWASDSYATAHEAYAAAHGFARGFAERQADRFGIRLEDLVGREKR